MKKVLVLLVLVLSGLTMNGQKFDKIDKSSMDVAVFPKSRKVSDKIVRITYSRPKLKGRVLESLVPTGEVWRTGANEATEITFYKNVLFGDKKVQAGTYTLFTIPGMEEWELILSKDINVWGASSYKQENDVVRVFAKVIKSKKDLEYFSIAFDKKMSLYMGWGDVLVVLPLKE